ncbi:uncharacterized protein LOC143030500 [Oratosquilla oratoria]|uniref:uncharacterized protein LOC143030500 n=1 Tax=Oratosquilla oratoria TaxID=337810 RepID=UPI003F777302
MCVGEVVDQADVIPGKWCLTGCTCVRAPSTSTQSSTSVTPSTSTIMTTPTSTAFKECETKTPCAKRQGVCLPLEAGCSTEVIGRGRPFCADDTCQCCLEISTSTESSTSVTTSPSTTTATTSTPVEGRDRKPFPCTSVTYTDNARQRTNAKGKVELVDTARKIVAQKSWV